MSKQLEPIAIVGIGCRFPGGAENPQKFWEVINNGVDGIVDVPKDRWDSRRFYSEDKERMGTSHAKQAGFLQSPVDEFDPLFFGISPREAAVLDPQQRLLLEITWEAFEDAGIREDQLNNSNTGVFIGGFTLDNKLIQLGQLNREILSNNTATSSTMVMLSNRISYTFNLKGPSVSMDTACSSSLVAAHYACQSIWSGETDMAVTGGANVMLTPEYPITMSKGQFLSDHSRCKAFDADARGYVRGEGGGIVILKPLSKAEADGDFIYGTIRASGANQDGATQGITVPNKDSQSDLVQRVYNRAGVSFDEVGYIEAHGTGTKAGDPVEIGALSKALNGRDLSDKCYVGSVKTNIGHLEAGAGVAGLIKATLSTHHRQIAPNLHFNNPNPAIDFDSIPLKVPTEVTKWPSAKKRAYASINSFGYGGTNAHVLVEGYENAESQTPTAQERARLFPISARSEKALKQTAVNLLDHIKGSDVNLDDLHYSLAHRRSHHHNRLAIKANSMEELQERLSDWTEDRFAPGMITGTVQADVAGKLVFVYTGMGPQWWAMGRQLLENEPVFRNKIEECDVIFKKIAGWSMIDELTRSEDESLIARTEIAQPTNFAIQIGLTALWEHWGITPDAVVGHSVGEVAAAYVSGALSLEDGLTVSYHRSRIQQKTAGQGKMLAIGIGEEEALKRLNGNPKISVAAINSFQAITLAGEEAALEEFATELTNDNIFNKMLRVEVAYHSYQMDPLKEELFESLANITALEPKLTLYSTVTGEQVKGAYFGTDYWWQNVRQPVRFAKAITQIVADGYNSFVEVGPHPVTRQSINECLSAADVSGNVVCSLIRNENEENTMFESLSQLYTIGYEPNWDVLSPKAHYVKLPTYAWQKEVYRHETDRSREYRLGTEGHIFLNDNLRQPEPAWEVELNNKLLPWLEDHQVEKAVVVPGAAYVEAGLAIHQKEFNDEACVLMDLKFNQVLVADPAKTQMMQTRYDSGSRSYAVYSREKGDTAGWQLHAKGRMLESNFGEEGGNVNFNELRSGFSNSIEPTDMYATLTNMGLYYGPYFQGLKQIYTRKDEVLCQIKGKEELDGNPDQYLLHPTILDSAFQSMVSLVEEEGNTTPYVPVNIDKFILYAAVGNSTWCHGTITERGKDSITGNILFFNEDGKVLAKLTGLKCRALTNKKGPKEAVQPEWFYGLEWKKAEETLEPTTEKMAVVAHNLSDQTMDLIGALTEAGVDVSVIEKADSFEQTDLGWQLNMGDAAQWKQLTQNLTEAGIYRYSFLLDAATSSNLNGTDLYNVSVENTVPVALFANAISEVNKDVPSILNLITRGAQVVADSDSTVDQSATSLWGFGQLVTNEYPWINTRMFDLDPANAEFDTTSINALVSDERVSEMAIRNGVRYTKELCKQEMTTLNDVAAREKVSTNEAVELNFGGEGRVDDLLHTKTERREPEANEIEVKVHSASINFKDLLKVLGQISQDVLDGTYFGNAFGMECSGTITRVGSDVTDFKVGEELVVATVDGCFRSYVTLVPEYTMRKPSTLKMEELPITIPYMTTIHGLTNIADVQPGEKVLIHNAAGAVGQAAIQVAKSRGAEIFATAGTEDKRAFIKSLGIEHVMNSRDLKFTEEILKITNGYGVDVVLNAIAGEGLYQSFKLLAPYGRFIEIGKRDIGENVGLPMAVFNRNITFAHIDIDRIMRERNALACSLLDKVYAGFENGDFMPMPTTVFGASEAIEAFDFVRRSEHTGKVAIRYENEEVEVETVKELNAIDPEGTYIITGGTGGFGLEIAKHLAKKNVSRLVLLSRSGLKNDDAKQAVAEFEAAGIEVLAPPTDISNPEQVTAVVESLNDGKAPVKGVFHGAMVLDDGFLNTMTRERFERVMTPKIMGAINLHNALGDTPLDFFISFSSISAVIGNAGQANYVAANAFLDGFAHFLRAKGLKATTVNLGVLGQVGVVARDADVGRLLEGAGIRSFSNQMALESLEHIIANDLTQVGLFDINWKKWAAGNPTGAATTLFASLIDAKANDDTVSEQTIMLMTNMAGMEKSDQQSHLEGLVCNSIAQVLRVPVENIDMNRGINFLGIDSLMAVELERGINASTGVEISTMELLSGPTVPQLASLILGKLPDPATLNIEVKETEEVNVDELSEEELDKLLETVS